MALTDADVRAGEARMEAKRKEGSAVQSARYDRRTSRIVVTMANGLEFSFPPEVVERLRGAPPAVLSDIEISPSGLGLHWPQVDEDLYVPALLQACSERKNGWLN